MSRRAHQNLACALLGTFVSRNNDLDGYWSVGRLCSEARRLTAAVIEVEILSGISVPDSVVAARVAEHYREWLRARMSTLPTPAAIASVTVRLNFAPEGPFRIRTDVFTYGEPYVCEVAVRNIAGVSRTSRHVGLCAPHDAARETQSTRALAEH